MEKLTERNEYGVYYPYCDSVKGCGGQCASCEFERKIANKLANYENAEKQGLLLRLPVAIGSEVWKIANQRDNFSDEPYRIATCVNFRLDMLSEIGKTVFLTKEEAEQALADMKGV